MNKEAVRAFLYFLRITDFDTLLEVYGKQLTRNKELHVIHRPNQGLTYDEVCNWPREKLAVICNNIIRRLRQNNKDYYHFYTNYLPYTVQKPCTNVKVWINQGNVLAEQTAVSCFARPAIMALDSSEEMAIFYRKIVLYPWSAQHVMVFEYNENMNYYTLLKYCYNRWKSLKVTVDSLFYISLPQGWRNVSDLYSILHPIYSSLDEYSTNKNNIVNTQDTVILFKICYVAFRAESYDRQLNFDGKRGKYMPHKLQATLRGPESVSHISVSIMAYKCKHSIFADTTFLSTYYVAAGPGDHSVILLEEVGNDNNGLPRYEIIEFIEHLTTNYFFFYFHKSY